MVSIGHSNATFEEAAAGIAAGARMFTHLFNAMRPLNHRDPGLIAAALTSEVAMPAVIPDGIHRCARNLAPHLYDTHRPARMMILTTDKVSLTASRAQCLSLYGRAQTRPRICETGAARLPDGTLAGAIISMLEGARLAIEKIAADLPATARMGALNPANLLGQKLRGRLQPGAVSDIIVLNSALELKAVFLAGHELN